MTTAMTWEQICDDPLLRDLPFKIEQDRYGRIVMSPPPTADHGRYLAEIAILLRARLPDWAIFGDCGVDTPEGVKVPDVAAMSGARSRRFRGVASLPESPEICVEILSGSNTPEEMAEKRRLYAGQGCLEFWTCSEAGSMAFFDAGSGSRLNQSLICPDFPLVVGLV